MELTLNKVCGWFLATSLALSIFSSFTHAFPSYYAGIPIWISAILFFPSIKPSQKKQVSFLLILGALGILFSFFYTGAMPDLRRALEANQKVVTMLIAVGFLKVCATAVSVKSSTLPTGRRALFRTLLGTHIFGAVLNMSSVIIIGDKLASQKKVTDLQALLLLRSFCACGFWSPFFAAMGLTLISAPGSQLSTLVMYGIPTCIVALLFSTWEILRKPESKKLSGYPMAFDSLWMPCFLACIVLIAHHLKPDISVLTLVSLTSIAFTFLLVSVRQSIFHSVSVIKNHIDTGIASSRNEVVLFASAALLAAGFAATMTALNLHLAPEHFGPLEASITLVILIALAITGMHPVTSVVLAGSILAPSVQDPNLLGMTMLMGWSLGVTVSPFSGVQLSIQSRYEISASALLKLNWRYALVMSLCCFLILWFYGMTAGLSTI